MSDQDDQELLQRWSRDRCEVSFRALVERHADLVFGTAMRRTADRQSAEEVSQNVFTALAQKAPSLDGKGGLGGWLFKSTILESAGCRRRERRRTQRMRELAESEAGWIREEERLGRRAEMDLVDDGMAELSAPDRAILVARFFIGSSFAELARTSARSEAACRKQVSRAVKRLAEILRGRGLRVSTRVVAASLSSVVLLKAPAGLAGTFATNAIMASAGAGATGGLTTFLTLMSTSKTVVVVVVGSVLLLASTGAGYLAGRGEARRREAAAAIPPAAYAVSARSAERDDADRGSASRSTGRAEATRGSRVEEIVKQLKKELRGRDPSLGREAAMEVAAALRGPEMEEAIALVMGEEEAMRGVLREILYRHWGELDGFTAANHALAQPEEHFRGEAVLVGATSWARVDPIGAWEWQEALRGRDDLPIAEASLRRTTGSVLREWAIQDMEKAWDVFEGLEPDLQLATLPHLDGLIVQPEHTAEMAERIAAISEESLRARVVEEVGEEWARVDPIAAANWFGRVEIEDPMLRLRTAMEIGETWFESDSPAAADWIWPMVPEEMRGHIVESFARSRWAESDPAGFGAWLKERGMEMEDLQAETR